MIGVIDFEKQKNAKSSYDANGNAIYYYAYNGYIYPDGTDSKGVKL